MAAASAAAAMPDFIREWIAICCSSTRGASEAAPSAAEIAEVEQRRHLVKRLASQNTTDLRAASEPLPAPGVQDMKDSPKHQPPIGSSTGSITARVQNQHPMTPKRERMMPTNSSFAESSVASEGSDDGNPVTNPTPSNVDGYTTSQVEERTMRRHSLVSAMSVHNLGHHSSPIANTKTVVDMLMMDDELLVAGETRLLKAVRQLNHQRLHVLLQNKKEDVNKADVEGATPLLVASAMGEEEMVISLLGGRADPNLADLEGVTPLQAAAHSGAPGIVQRLIRAGAKLDQGDIDECTALYQAVTFADKEAHEEVATILLAAGADPTAAAVDGSTPLTKAEESGNMPLLQLLRAAAESATSSHTGNEGRRKKRVSADGAT